MNYLLNHLINMMSDYKTKLARRAPGKPTRFYVDNEFTDLGYARLLGKYANVYLALLRHANAKEQFCFLRYETIMTKSGVRNRNTLSRIVRAMEFLQLIEVERGGRGKANNYFITDCSQWKSLSSITIDTTLKVLKLSHKQYQKRHFPSIKSDTLIHSLKSDKEIKGANREILDKTKKELEERGVLHKTHLSDLP